MSEEQKSEEKAITPKWYVTKALVVLACVLCALVLLSPWDETECDFVALVLATGNLVFGSKHAMDMCNVEKTATLWSPSLYSGRFTRAQYWVYSIAGVVLFPLILIFFLAFVDSTHDMKHGEAWYHLAVLWIVALCVYFLPIQIKRAHDIGESSQRPLLMCMLPWLVEYLLIGNARYVFRDVLQIRRPTDEAAMVYLFLLPLIHIIYCVWLGCKDSQKGSNAYGASAKYPD